jgi:signal transduction histidine kinase
LLNVSLLQEEDVAGTGEAGVLTSAAPPHVTLHAFAARLAQRVSRHRGPSNFAGGTRSVRTYIFSLILAVLLPAFGFTSFLVLRSAANEQDYLAGDVSDRAQAVAGTIDLLVSDVRGRLFSLPGTNPLEGAALARFYQRTLSAFEDRPLTVVLSDPAGHEIFNTLVPFGNRVPMHPDQDAVRKVVETGMPYISDLRISALTEKPVVNISVPVMRDGRVQYVLSADILPLLTSALEELGRPNTWLYTLIDREGYTLARTRAGDRFVGQLSQPSFLQRIHATNEGWVPGTSRDGVPSYVGFSHARLSGWTVAVAVPAEVVVAPVRRSTMVLVLAGICVLVLALAAALLIARRISGPIVRLALEAQTVGQVERRAPQATGLREADVVAESLFDANRRLIRHGAERDEALHRLQDSEQRFRGLVDELTVANAERMRLLHGTVQAQEAERTRIARELHDSLGQYVTALRLGLGALGQRTGDCEQIVPLTGLTDEIGRELRRLAWELRPPALDDLGLATAIRQLAENWATHSALHFDLEIALGDRRLASEVETTLYRVAQEALTNVVKHARANRVSIVLRAGGGEVRLLVEDDGQAVAPPAAPAHKRFGLLNMRERLALVGGSFEMQSTPGKGTRITARIPA